MKKTLLIIAILVAPQLAAAQEVCIQAITICDAETGKYHPGFDGSASSYCEALEQVACERIQKSYIEDMMRDSSQSCDDQVRELSFETQKAQAQLKRKDLRMQKLLRKFRRLKLKK